MRESTKKTLENALKCGDGGYEMDSNEAEWIRQRDGGSPAHLHDCEHCKFSWCCGYTCACVFVFAPIPEPPEDIKAKVNTARSEKGLTPIYD